MEHSSAAWMAEANSANANWLNRRRVESNHNGRFHRYKPLWSFPCLNSCLSTHRNPYSVFSGAYARSVHARPVHIRASAVRVRPVRRPMGGVCDAPRRSAVGSCGRPERLDGATAPGPPRRHQSGHGHTPQGLRTHWNFAPLRVARSFLSSWVFSRS